MIKFHKSEISLLKDQNSFLKSELQKKQIIVEKLVDLQKDQSKINCSNKVHNKHDNSRSNFDNTCLDKNLTVKNKSTKTAQFKVTRKTQYKSNTIQKKVIVVGDSIKFLRSDELSTSERSVTIMKLPWMLSGGYDRLH